MNDTPKCEPPAELRGVDGWHWLTSPFDDDPTIGVWEPDGWWTTRRHDYKADKMVAFGYRYHSPVLTPAEADTMRAERDDWQQAAQVEADHVNALRARVAVLEEALQSIANHPEAEIVLTDYGPDGRQRVWPTVAQEARAALSTGSKTPAGTRGEP